MSNIILTINKLVLSSLKKKKKHKHKQKRKAFKQPYSHTKQTCKVSSFSLWVSKIKHANYNILYIYRSSKHFIFQILWVSFQFENVSFLFPRGVGVYKFCYLHCHIYIHIYIYPNNIFFKISSPSLSATFWSEKSYARQNEKRHSKWGGTFRYFGKVSFAWVSSINYIHLCHSYTQQKPKLRS